MMLFEQIYYFIEASKQRARSTAFKLWRFLNILSTPYLSNLQTDFSFKLFFIVWCNVASSSYSSISALILAWRYYLQMLEWEESYSFIMVSLTQMRHIKCIELWRFFKFWSTPWSDKVWTTLFKLFFAASCNGVSPPLSCLITWAPAYSINLMMPVK